jgi:hypothetical protein
MRTINSTKEKLEMRNSKRCWSFVIAPIIAASLALVIFAPNYFTNNPPENPIIRTIALSYAFDVTDTRRLVGWADNVFIGKVIRQDGTKSRNDIPETQFKVELSDNVKGKLNGTVILNQQGGYKGIELILIANEEAKQELIEKYTTAYKNEIPFDMSK